MPSKAQDYGYVIKDGWLYNEDGERIPFPNLKGDGWRKYYPMMPKGDYMDRAITILYRLRKEYDIKDDHVEGLFTILYDVARFGYAGDGKE